MGVAGGVPFLGEEGGVIFFFTSSSLGDMTMMSLSLLSFIGANSDMLLRVFRGCGGCRVCCCCCFDVGEFGGDGGVSRWMVTPGDSGEG